MMHREATLPYVQSELCPGVVAQAVGIPCRAQSAVVYFVIPYKWFELSEVVNRLTGDRAARLISYCRPRRVQVSIPKIHMSFDSELRSTFSSLGVDAWLRTNNPAFDGMVRRGGGVSLGQLYHQVVLKINEDGDRPGNDQWIDEREEPAEFKCNQPFVILFHHEATNAIWTLARVVRPSTNGPEQPPAPPSSSSPPSTGSQSE